MNNNRLFICLLLLKYIFIAYIYESRNSNLSNVLLILYAQKPYQTTFGMRMCEFEVDYLNFLTTNPNEF